jgi:hypothetical protein
MNTFGPLEIVRLSLKKIRSGQKNYPETQQPSGVDIYAQKDWTNIFYASILNSSEKEIEKARDEYARYRIAFEKKVTSPRKQFFQPIFDLGPGMSEFLYISIAVKKPNKIVETGVAAGVSTNTILHALHSNGNGKLTSIDITDQVGELVDGAFKSLWKILVLPEIGREKSFARYLQDNIDATIFLHDSDHSGSWQKKEFIHVVRELSKIELILFDDIGQELIDYIHTSFADFKIIILDENRKFSGIIYRLSN